jgi:hypothetical protein
MAWTAPRTWSVAEVVTAAMLNTHVRDNLNYLKGNAGAVDLVNTVNLKPASGNPELGMYLPANTAVAQAVMYDQTATYRGIFGYGGSAYANAALQNCAFFLTNGTSGDFVILPNGVETARWKVGGAAYFKGAGGGFIFLSANAVDGTLQTLAAAGTVTQSAAFWAYDRNNTGGAFVQVSGNMLALGGTFNLVNTDTVQVAVSAGGAITVQRTAGTNGTHQVNMLVLYK